MGTKKLVTQINIPTLGYHIDRTLSAMIRNLNKELKQSGSSFQHSHFSIMKVLNEVDGMCQADLSKITGKDRASVSRAINFLEENGYVKRQVVNGCKNSVSLTEKGKECIPFLNEISLKITNKAFVGFKEKERKQIL